MEMGNLAVDKGLDQTIKLDPCTYNQNWNPIHLNLQVLSGVQGGQYCIMGPNSV